MCGVLGEADALKPSAQEQEDWLFIEVEVFRRSVSSGLIP